MVDHAEAVKKFRDATLTFLLTELGTAETFAEIASESEDGEKTARNRQNARKAYDTLLRFMPLLSPEDSSNLLEKLNSLKSKLIELGEEI